MDNHTKTCANCKFFKKYYVIQNCKFFTTGNGFCTNNNVPKNKKAKPYAQACEFWADNTEILEKRKLKIEEKLDNISETLEQIRQILTEKE